MSRRRRRPLRQPVRASRADPRRSIAATRLAIARAGRQADFDAAIRAFEAVADEPAARERLAELRAARDEAQDRLAELAAASAPAVIITAGDWDVLTDDERRALIRATIAEAVVSPGRGSDRMTDKPRGE